MTNFFRILLSFVLLIILNSCVPSSEELAENTEPQPTPTNFFLFSDGVDSPSGSPTPPTAEGVTVPTTASLFSERATPTPSAPSTPTPVIASTNPSPPSSENNAQLYPIFDDQLHENWELTQSSGGIIDMNNSIRVQEGQNSIAFTPEVEFSTLYFTVKDSASQPYPEQAIIGISLWVNGGDDYLQLDNLALAVIGSNEYHTWVENDQSVEFPAGETFSETRLYFLGLNRSIPPNSWVEVFLPFDNLIFDPPYEYVVGFYLKSGEAFFNTIYVDNVNLVVTEDFLEIEPAPSQTMTPTPTATTTPTPQPEPTITPTIESDTSGEEESNASDDDDAECLVDPPPGWALYAIQAGDTISSLAFSRRESTELVLNVNCISDTIGLSVGQEIWLPPAIETP
jgi:hypothetical protein